MKSSRTLLYLFPAVLCIAPLAAPLVMSGPAPADEKEEKFRLDSDWMKPIEWRSIGPANMGGRCVAFAVTTDDPNHYWVATASGGLLKTTNGGTTYEHQFDHENTVSIGHVAVAPSDPKIVWVGTGEANPRNSVSYGDGVYKSTDGGETWKHMGLKETFQTGRIGIHPENPDIVYVGSLGRLYGTNEERGLYKTTDGGENWERILYIDEKSGVIDVDMHPTEPDTLVVAFYERQRDGFDTNSPSKNWGPGSGVYRTRDGGQTWVKLTNGLPSVEMGRIGIDYCREHPDILMAVIETERIGKLPDDAAYMGMSGENADVGARLTNITKEGPAEKAGLKKGDIVLAVDEHRILGYEDLMRTIRQHKAGDKVMVELVRERELMTIEIEFEPYAEDSRGRSPYSSFLGGQRENVQDEQGRGSVDMGGIYKSTDGGDSWERINSLNPRPMYYSQIRIDPGDPERVYVLGTSLWKSKDGGKTFTGDGGGRGVHVDHHALWIDPRDGRHMYLGNDGGIFVTNDRMKNWDHHNHMAIGQFYHVTTDNRPVYRVYGGLQDNGSWGAPNRTRESTGPLNTDWIMVGWGDGFVCRTDPNDPDQVYYESQGGAMGWRNLRTGESGGARPVRQRGVRYRFNWETPYLLSHFNSRIFYAAGNYVFRSLDRGADMRAISPEITLTDRGSATALAESPHDSDVLWVGTDDGALWVTRDGGQNWTDLLQPPPVLDHVEVAERRGAVLVQLLEGLDKNDDGKVEKDEVPERLLAVLGQADTDGDGVISAKEVELLTGEDPEEEEAEEAEEETAAAKPGDPLSGHWTAKLIADEVPAGTGEFEMTFKKDEKGKRSGELVSDVGEGSLSEISYDTETKKLSCVFTGDEMSGTIEATVTGEKMEGSLSMGDGAFTIDFEAKRDKAAAAEEPAKEEKSEKTKAKKKKKEKERLPTIAEHLPEPMWVSSLEASRHQEGRVYVAIDGHRSNHDDPFIYVSEDWGATWKSLVGKLPRGSTRCLREDIENENVLYLGTEFGAYVSLDRGISWAKMKDLPTVSVHDFAQHPTMGDIVVGTHGRSLWVFDATPLRQYTRESMEEAENWLFKPKKALVLRNLPSRGPSGTRRFVGENPSSNAKIVYRLGSKAKDFSLSILGAGGEIVRTLEAENKRGLRSVTWDLRRAARSTAVEGQRRRYRGGRRVPPGTYQVVLQADGRKWTQPLVIEGDPDYPDAVQRYEVEELEEYEAEEDDRGL